MISSPKSNSISTTFRRSDPESPSKSSSIAGPLFKKTQESFISSAKYQKILSNISTNNENKNIDFKKEISRFFMVDELLIIRLKTEFHTLQETLDSQWLEVVRKIKRFKMQSPQKEKRKKEKVRRKGGRN